MKTNSKTSPWFERPYVTVAEAALVVSRSQTWVRNKIVSGALETASLSEAAPTCVTTRSITALIARLADKPACRGANALRLKRRNHLRLVWVNHDK